MPRASEGGALVFGRINHAAYGRDPVGRNARTPGVFANNAFIGGKIDAVDLIFRHVAMEPLNLRS